MDASNTLELGEARSFKSEEAEAGATRRGMNDVTRPDDTDSITSLPHARRAPELTSPGELDQAMGDGKRTTDDNNDSGKSVTESQLAPSNSLRAKLDHSKIPKKKTLLCDNQSEPGIINFKELSKLTITFLQYELLKIQAPENNEYGIKNALESQEVEDLLHRYTTAVRDYEFIAGHGESAGVQQYFWEMEEVITAAGIRMIGLDKWKSEDFDKAINLRRLPTTSGNDDPLRKALQRFLPRSLTWTNMERDNYIHEYFRGGPPVTASPFIDRLARFIVAFTGGLSLVVPMLIMRIHQDSTKSLITTSVAVVLFSAVVSIVFHASNAETLGITAAYAAVLVVFVGTSS